MVHIHVETIIYRKTHLFKKKTHRVEYYFYIKFIQFKFNLKIIYLI